VEHEEKLRKEGGTDIVRVESIDQLTPQYVQAYRDLANKPMPPLPKDFLKSVK